MFYRPGGSETRINAQFDEVFADFVDGATGWLPIVKGNTIGVNVARARIEFNNAASSKVTRVAVAPEVLVLMELKTMGLEDAWPVDQWQNTVVATSRRAHRDGWVRLRIVNINAIDGSGVSMAMQVSRTGDVGAST